MKSYEERHAEAKGVYQAGLKRVAEADAPKGQKFMPGERVYIQKDLGCMMSHFKSGVWATVKYTYAHAFPWSPDNVQSYCLDIDDYGEVSWYLEHQLHREMPENDS